MKRHILRWGSVLFIGIFGLSSVALAQNRQLKICVPDYSVGVLPFFIAKERGYLAQEHLDVEVVAARGNLCTLGLISDSFQFTYSPSTFDSVVSGDVKGKVIYVAEKFLLHRFIVSPKIKSFENLKGKKIAISAYGSLTDLLTREILLDHGLQPMKDVLLLQTGGAPVRYAALKSGNVQAALLSSQHALAALRDGFHQLEYNPPPYVSHPLIVKDELLARDKPLVRSLLRALLKGHLVFGQKPQETLDVAQKVLRIDNRKTAQETYEDEMRRYNPGGGFEESKMRKVIERAREARKVTRKVEIQDVFDLSMAEQVEAELKNEGWKP